MTQLGPNQSPVASTIEQIGLAGFGAAVIVLALRWVTGLVSRDNDERIVMRADVKLLREALDVVRSEVSAAREMMVRCDVERAALERRVHELEERKE